MPFCSCTLFSYAVIEMLFRSTLFSYAVKRYPFTVALCSVMLLLRCVSTPLLLRILMLVVCFFPPCLGSNQGAILFPASDSAHYRFPHTAGLMVLLCRRFWCCGFWSLEGGGSLVAYLAGWASLVLALCPPPPFFLFSFFLAHLRYIL